MAAPPPKFFLLSEGGFTYWLPGHKPSPQEASAPTTIVPVDLATSANLQTPQSSVRLYLIGSEIDSQFLLTGAAQQPAGTTHKEHWSQHECADLINQFKARAAADPKYITGYRHVPGQAPPLGLPSKKAGAAPAAAVQQPAHAGYPPAPHAQQAPTGYGAPPAHHGYGQPPSPYGGAPPAGGNMFGAPPPHMGAPPGGAYGAGPAAGQKFVSVDQSRRTEDPLPAQVLAKYKNVTKETHDKFINQRTMTYLTSLKNTGGTVWLREFTPMPQHYKMLVQSSTRFTSVKITQVIHMPMCDVVNAKPVMISDQKLCTYFLAKGYCSRPDCIHVHRTPEQVKFLIAGMHAELKAMTSEERKARQDQLIENENRGEGGMPSASRPYGALPSHQPPAQAFPYQTAAAAAPPPPSAANGQNKDDSSSSSSSSSDSSDSDSDSSSSSSSSSGSSDRKKRGKRGRSK